jgi:hypothetical protein
LAIVKNANKSKPFPRLIIYYFHMYSQIKFEISIKPEGTGSPFFNYLGGFLLECILSNYSKGVSLVFSILTLN